VKHSRFILCVLTFLIVFIGLSLTLATRPEIPPPTSTSTASDESLNTDFSDYIWPTDAGRIVTSTFAEYRRIHFHGGIDISTGNQTGYKVFAARDGYISRIRVSPTGYGKMLYLRDKDGYFTTYAHLSAFNAEIEARVRREQNTLERYPIDIECGTGEFPVKKGDIIAYTGDTGVGSPHLHFEIRDTNLDFVNPMLCKEFSRTDRIRPTVRKIAVRPLGENSTVDGETNVKLPTIRFRSSGVYEVSKPIQITGSAGFAIDVRDQSEGSRFRHGVYTHEIHIDDQVFYTVRLHRAPSGHAHQSGLYYDWELVDAGKGRFQKLYVDSANDLLFYSPREESAGILRLSKLSEGLHSFSIVSSDQNGNSSEVKGSLVLNHPPKFNFKRDGEKLEIAFPNEQNISKIHVYTRSTQSSKWASRIIRVGKDEQSHEIPAKGFEILKVIAENSWGSKSLPSFYFLKKPTGEAGTLKLIHEIEPEFVRVHLRSEGPITADPILKIYEGTVQRTLSLKAVDIDHYVGTFRPIETFAGTRRLIAEAEVRGNMLREIDEFDLYPIPRHKSGILVLDNGNVLLSYDSSSVLKTIFMEVEKQEDGSDVSYLLKPEYTVLNQGITVAVRTDGSPRKRGLFLHNRRGWEMLASGDDALDGILSGLVTQTLGEVGIFTDSIPPAISRVEIRQPRKGVPDISFRFSDDFSGIEYDELKMYIDGEVAIPEIDGEHRRARYHATDPLTQGSHLLTIRVKDKLGNTAEIERRFSVR